MPASLIAVGDSAYQAPSSAENAVDPLVMRGYIIALAHYKQESSSYALQLFTFDGGKQNHVGK